MKKNTKVILFVIVSVVMFAPMVNELLDFPKFRRLSGVVYDQPMPKLTLKSYATGEFQSKTESYLKQHFGFRPPLIRFYNQYLWDFFRKTSVEGAQIVFGKDGWIYEPWFVEEYYQGRMYRITDDSAVMKRSMDAEAKRLYQLQHILAPYGTYLFTSLLPGKEAVYPEYLPANDHYNKKKVLSAHDFYVNKFNELGLNYIDVQSWFQQMKDTADFPLFYPTGTHWSNISSMYALDSIMHYMEHISGLKLTAMDIGKPYLGKVKSPDDDLVSLMNLMRPIEKVDYYYVDVKPRKDSTAVKPKLIVIGDSFYWNIVKQVDMHDYCYSNPYWYYNSSVFYDDPHTSVKDLNIVDEMLSSDFIMLSYCSSMQYEMSNGFSQQALMDLCYDQSEVDEVKNALHKYIRKMPDWMKKVEVKAEQKGISVDEALDKEVNSLIAEHPERYFPALADSIPTKRSSAVRNFFDHDSISTVDKNIELTVKKIKSSPSWLHDVEQKALKNGKDLETQLRKDAHWVVDRKIERGEIVFRKKYKKAIKPE